jgi:hypothetical protein
MSIVKCGETIQDELSSGWSREIEHDLAGEVTFPVFIDCVYQQGRYDEHGVARHGYAADAPFIDTPRDAREHYNKCFGIESSYRLAKQSLAFTSSQDAGLRLVIFVLSLLLQNSWRYLHWKYVATPRRRGRRLWRWPFTEFCEMVVRAAWTALGVRRAVPANQLLDDRFSGSCPPVRTAVVSGGAVASAAVRRRQRPLSSKLTVRPTSRQSKHRPNRFSAY